VSGIQVCDILLNVGSGVIERIILGPLLSLGGIKGIGYLALNKLPVNPLFGYLNDGFPLFTEIFRTISPGYNCIGDPSYSFIRQTSASTLPSVFDKVATPLTVLKL
jgi:hypothetical protein